MKMPDFAAFLQAAQRSLYGKVGWIREGNLSVYVRYGSVLVGSNLIPEVVTIANVTCSRKSQGKGEFTRFLHSVEEKAKGVFIENVLEPRFARFFERKGYVRTQLEATLTVSFYKDTSLIREVVGNHG